MVSSQIDGINLAGFSEPITIAQLRRTCYTGIPKSPGIYLIVRTQDRRPCFLPEGRGGWFKDKDPSYPLDVVEANWVEVAHVMYVGMTKARKGLKGRLGCFFEFGRGRSVGHRGGRLLWHLPDSEKLWVQWRTCPATDADQAESAAIASFKAVYDARRPFANWTK